MESNETVCYFCKSSSPKYVCPRCNISYCSVQCYQSPAHSDCSESFYKDNVKEWLAAESPDSESKKRMIEILQRVNNQNVEEEPGNSETDSDDELTLADRMASVDLNDADDIWTSLLPEERQEFIDLIKNGDVSQLIPKWDPWWEKEYRVPKVRFLDDDAQPPEYANDCPRLYDKVSEFSSLCKKQPSPQVYFNFINVIASYAITSRYFNGDLTSLPLETASTLIFLSKNLNSDEIFTCGDSAITSVSLAVTDCPWVTLELDVKLDDLLNSDIKSIVKGPNEEDALFYAKAALSESINILIDAKKSFKLGPHKKGEFSTAFCDSSEGVQTVQKSTLTKCAKKLEYYLSWVDVHLPTYR